jgi:hypothetical protein
LVGVDVDFTEQESIDEEEPVWAGVGCDVVLCCFGFGGAK